MKKYDAKKVEKKWQKKWFEERIFKASEKSKKPKYYQLETFPYPSAAGLHVGHPKGYIAEDIHARYKRMNGFEVLYTIGWDAFGLPTENYAIQIGKNPKDVAEDNIKNFKRQVRMFGFSYDWDREINTSDPNYYKWTQWIFIQLFKKGLTYRKRAKVNWCPKDQTVLANEQVIEGKCERDGEEVQQKEMEQWFFKITDYADSLIKDLEGLDWPEATIKRQKDWIGRSEGALLDFPIQDSSFKIQVFTTRPDTLFGATYLVLAPEHPFVASLTEVQSPKRRLNLQNIAEVRKYFDAAKRKTELMRQAEVKDKTGVELKGIKAVNPATKEEIPIWVADYVLMGYGTGAIMAVPAHDERDFEFAKKFNLPIRKVILPKPLTSMPRNAEDIAAGARDALRVEAEVWTSEGEMVNSGKFDGMSSAKAKWGITKFVRGKKQIQYKLRDWSVSRQRYWGVPIPMIHCNKCGIQPVPEKELPVELPELKDYRPRGMPPLASSEKFIKVKCPKCGGDAKRDAETLDTFVDSSWYYLAYAMQGISNFQFPISNYREVFKYWLPVDLYVIGAEHTVLHLLYSRFITKFLQDEGYLSFSEPFLKLRHVGLILGEDGQKMSKSRGNVVNPDEIVGEFGADATRMYEMFMGPFEEGQPWDPKGVIGMERFLSRVWRVGTEKMVFSNSQEHWNKDLEKLLHKTIKKITEDIEGLKFNTAISALMILINEMEKQPKLPITNFQLLLKLLHPFAPHITQELWSQMGNDTILTFEEWPKYDPNLIKQETYELIIQVNGKSRDRVEVSSTITQSQAEKTALRREKIKKILGDKKPKKAIFVKGRLINFVTS